MTDTHISERYEFRNIKQNEAEEAAEIERICFPPNEACSKKHMKDRVAGIADLFLVAIDKENGKMAGFLNGLATDDEILKEIHSFKKNHHIFPYDCPIYQSAMIF